MPQRNRLTLIYRVGPQHGKFSCTCGGSKVILLNSVKYGKTRSCGCLLRETSAVRARIRNTTHGMSRTKIYAIWGGVVDRATNSTGKYAKKYCNRGIGISKPWLRFEKFFEDMGDRPEGKSLERRDNNLGYSRENCYWATPKQQNNNKSSNVWLSLGKTRKTIVQWEEHLGLTRGTIYHRLQSGWSLERILTTPKK